MKNLNKKKYEGFSLIEMLLTIAIISFVMTISAAVLSTLIRVSTSSSNKIRARNESEFVLELVRRTVRNSNPKDIRIFNNKSGESSSRPRTYDPQSNKIIPNPNTTEEEIASLYAEPLEEGEIGNEIHFKPYGYKDWICLGFFKSKSKIDSENPVEKDQGYIIMTSNSDLISKHEKCFADPPYLIVLNSPYINARGFNIFYTVSGDMSYLISFDVILEPLDWYLGGNPNFIRQVIRQGVVSTEGLIW